MAWQASAPTEDKTKRFLIDLVRQLGRGFITCRSIKKTVRTSSSEVVKGRPLVDGMTIELDFDIFYKPNAVVST